MRYDLVTIVASRRGLIALRHLLAELPASFATPIACLVESHPGLAEDLQAGSRLPVRWATAGERIAKGCVYLSRPGTSLICMPDGTFGIAPFGAESSALNPVDTFLGSAALVHPARTLALVLSGFDRDGVTGCEAIKQGGGTVLVLDRATAHYWGMAEPIVQSGAADRVLTIVEVAEALRGCFTTDDLLRCAEIQVQLGELLEAAMRLAGTRMGHVTRRSQDSGKLFIIVQRGLGLDFFEHFEAMPSEAEASWCRAVRFKQRIVIPDVMKEPRHPAHGFERLSWRAEFAVPLLLPQPEIQVHGAITTLFPEPRGFAVLDSAGLDRVAQQASELVARVS